MAKTTARTVLRDLGDGLLLRRATPRDTDELVAFNVRIHCEHNPSDVPFITYWMKDLMSGRHPTFRPADFTVVEDTKAGKIVSSLNLISQVWSYGGVKFGLGRPELVGTDPKYRNRGLVRAQFETVHEWSRQRKELAQAITGIPTFYRQFGYEMTLPLGVSCRGHKSQVPKLKAKGREPYRFRPATKDDLPFLTRTYQRGMGRYLVACARDQAMWQYELNRRSKEWQVRSLLRVIENPQRERLGLLVHSAGGRWGHVDVSAWEMVPRTNWLAVAPSVLRYLVKMGEEFAARDRSEFQWYRFNLDADHPGCHALGELVGPAQGTYTYFLRVPDLVAFLQRITPVLEQRLANSLAAGYTGELKIWCSGQGARISTRVEDVTVTAASRGVLLAFERGRVARVGSLKTGEGASVLFADQTFLHVLFGHKTLAEVSEMYPDSHARGREANLLMEILFPKQPSHIWPVY